MTGRYHAGVPFFGHKTRREREWEEVRSQAQDDLVALGDDIRALDVDIQMPDATSEAKQRYGQALEAYQRASGIFDAAKRPEDLSTVTETMEEGRFAMACAKALLEGRPPPERTPPSTPATVRRPRRSSGRRRAAASDRYPRARPTR